MMLELLLDDTTETLGISLAEFLVVCKLANSKKEAKRLIEQGGVKLDNVLYNDVRTRISHYEKIFVAIVPQK